jgi:enoyl-CoA hydratase
VLALCCDHRVAVEEVRTKIGVNEVALGVCFPPRILNICRSRIPRRHHDEVLLGARLYAPADALRLGLVDEVSSDAEALARRRLAELAAIPRRAYATTKAVLHGEAARLDEADERRFREIELPLWRSPEVRQRVLAVLGK